MLNNFGGAYIDRGVRVSIHAPWVNHLLFADDCLIFMKADSRSAIRLNEILYQYSIGSGQCANKQKSSVFFSPNSGSSVKRGVKAVLQIQREAMSEKYLGLPTPEGRMNRGKFQDVQAKMLKRLLQWVDCSLGGKEVLVKAVAQALPTYLMGAFKLPDGLCEDLRKMIWDFLLGANQGL